MTNNKSNDKGPLVSIVICAFSSKRFDMTIDCIRTIFHNTYKNYEIVLVIDGNHELKQRMDDQFKKSSSVICDNNDNNDNNIICDNNIIYNNNVIYNTQKDITIIENEKNEGPSVSRNRGVERAKGDIVVFIDDDAFASADWLERIVKDFDDYPDVSVVGGKLLLVYEEGSKKLPEEILWLVGGTYKGHPIKRQFVRNVFTGNMAIKRNVFIDTNFEIMCDKKKNAFLSHQLEDTLFCVRVNNKKRDSVLYDPEIVAYHHVPNDRLKLLYLLRRSLSEGILKAKLKHVNDEKSGNNDTNKSVNNNNNGKNDTLSEEQNYLSNVLASIIKNFCTLKIRDCILLSLVVSSVATGYIISSLKKDI